MTYESAEEAKVLRSIWGRGDLQNTVFAILDPYGRPIVNGQRSPQRIFRDSTDMATYMDQVAAHYRGHGDPTWLPVVDTVRLGLNVAACDSRPLVIVVAPTKTERDSLQARLAPAAWSDRLVGKLVYTAGTASELRNIRGARINSGYLFVKPNDFGTEGEVVTQLSNSATATALTNAAMQTTGIAFAEKLSQREHVMRGRRSGQSWDTAIPVTDQQALRAQQLGPGRRGF